MCFFSPNRSYFITNTSTNSMCVGFVFLFWFLAGNMQIKQYQLPNKFCEALVITFCLSP